MNREPANDGVLWIISEICYYPGLMLMVLLPVLSLGLWMMSLVEKADPNYWYLSIAWVLSVLMFLVGVGIKNHLSSAKNDPNEADID